MWQGLTNRQFNLSVSGSLAATCAALLVLIGGILTTNYVGRLVERDEAAQTSLQASLRVKEVATRFEGRIREIMALGKGLQSLVEMQPDITDAFFARYAAKLLDDHPTVRAVSLAPDNQIRYVYPPVFNKNVVGVNLQTDPSLWPTVQRAMEGNEIFVSGPEMLASGAVGFLVRVPIFTKVEKPALSPMQHEHTGEAYWGVVSLAIDYDALLAAAGISAKSDAYSMSIVRAQPAALAFALGANGSGQTVRDRISVSVDLPGTDEWEIVYLPSAKVGPLFSLSAMLTYMLGVFASLVLSVVAFFLVNEVFQVRRMALHDPLTGLANRILLHERMDYLARLCERNDGGYHIVYIDLDGFKPINDTYGHDVGDRVLKETANRLRNEIRSSDTAARIGGDEFVVLLSAKIKPDDMAALLDRMLTALRSPIVVGRSSLTIDMSIGVANYPEDATSVQELLNVADARMYEDKHGSKKPTGEKRRRNPPVIVKPSFTSA